MSDFKKQCIQFKQNAKKLGYDLKLTHIQELLAKIDGFENRHAKLSTIKNKKTVKKEPTQLLEQFFCCNYFAGRKDSGSYFIAIKSDQKLMAELDEDEILIKAVQTGQMEEMDIDYITDIEEITKEEYLVARPTKNKSSGVKIKVNTDDNVFDFSIEVEEELMLWMIYNDRGTIEMFLDGHYGPDNHTDNFIYNMTNDQIHTLKTYLEIMSNNKKTVGFSVVVDKDSFLEWKKKYCTLLQDNHFLV